jgi:hypothetical protein
MHDVLRLDTAELLMLFQKLEAPGLEEMHGEYPAQLLLQPGAVATVAGQLSLYNPLYPGMWLAKAFRPVGDGQGRGYNVFRHFGRVVQGYAMATLVAPSRYDGGPAFQLVYRAFKSYCGFIHMVDEVRRLDAGQYLGIGTVGFSAAQRQVPRPFLMTGPVAPYRGDIGRERVGFKVASELPGLSGKAA